MDIATLLSGIVVVGFGLFLISLAAVIASAPSLAERFLGSFASSATAHYTEQGLRLLVGAALVSVASAMRYPELFTLFGWVIVGTTVGLLTIPWQWHQRFAARVMPPVIRHMRFFALGAAALGAFILYSVSRVVTSGR
jgi:hypothetical protein